MEITEYHDLSKHYEDWRDRESGRDYTPADEGEEPIKLHPDYKTGNGIY